MDRQQQQPPFRCVITPNFVLTALAPQGHRKAIKNGVKNHYRSQALHPKLLRGPVSEQSTGERRNSAGNLRPFGVYPFVVICKLPCIMDVVASSSDGLVLPDVLLRLMVINKEENI